MRSSSFGILLVPKLQLGNHFLPPDADFSASVLRAEGPAVRPAQGNALGNGDDLAHLSAQRANHSTNGWPVGPTTRVRSGDSSQGVALGWVNSSPFGAD